jgi:F-type H+-transporting ATPase subunit c
MKLNLAKVMSSVFTLFALAGVAAAQSAQGEGRPLINVTGALAVAIAAGLAALGDSKAIAAACEGAARNPAAVGSIQTLMIIGLALIETLVLLTFVLAFLGR